MSDDLMNVKTSVGTYINMGLFLTFIAVLTWVYLRLDSEVSDLHVSVYGNKEIEGSNSKIKTLDTKFGYLLTAIDKRLDDFDRHLNSIDKKLGN